MINCHSKLFIIIYSYYIAISNRLTTRQMSSFIIINASIQLHNIIIIYNKNEFPILIDINCNSKLIIMHSKRQYSFQEQCPSQKISHLQLKRVHSVTNPLQDETVYQLIFTHQVIKNIEIVSLSKEKDNISLHKKHIVHYVIQINTDYFDYQIQRRYKQFLELYKQLKPNFKFNEFPQKKLFKSNKSEVVQERRKSLQKFLQTILSSLEQQRPIEFLKFIEIKEQFMKKGFDNIKLHGLSSDQFNLDSLLEPELQKHQPQNDIEKTSQGGQNENYKISQLENILFGKLQYLSYNIMQFLFIGDKDKEIMGLTQMIQNDSDSHIQCNCLLSFLSKLLDFEYNPFAEISLKAFCELNMKQIKQMKLQNHIKDNQQNKCYKNALQLLHKYLEGNPLLDQSIVKFLIEDEETVYQLIFTHQVIKNIEIVSLSKEKDNISLHKKHIVHYVIQINTDYFDYQIQRRYKQFLELYKQLKPNFKFNEFPQKKLFKSNKSEVVQERRKSLQKFLQTILSSLEQQRPIEFLKFIEIKEQFMKKGFDNIKLHGLSSDQFNLDSLLEPELQKHQPQNDIEKTSQGGQNENYKISQLENILFGKLQYLSYNIMQFLFIGDKDKEIMGLTQMIQNDSDSHIQCNCLLSFLSKLLDFEYNPFAEISLKAFCELNMKQIKQMKLQNHIKDNQQNKCYKNALQLLHKYLEGNPLLDQSIVKFLIEDEEVLRIYQNFKSQRKTLDSAKNLDSSDEYITPASTSETIRKFSSKDMILLEDDNTPQFLIKILTLNYNWKLVKQYKNCSLLHLQGQIIKNSYILKCNQIQKIYKLFTEQKQWRNSFKKFQIIDQIDENNFIALESSIWSIKSSYQTFIFLSKFSLKEQSENKISFTVEFLKDSLKVYMNYVKKNELLCKKVSYVEIFKIDQERIEVITVTNLIDQEQKNHVLPSLLNEDNSYEVQIDKLYQLL
ncbi:unnamed protein product [Paramecium sonneborni]|uniref:PX domain-containing protein n=1 Tax=Paramecium sonneborni TaxID=65129 RepID=A0A8S1RGM2_9CILI|nr:unnamed protein product [Paramecium sonneborni]